MAHLNLRVELGATGAIGPGKIRLLEEVGEHGSIAAAARAMRMSYRRAWLLIDALNHSFREPVVAAVAGGKAGGGAALTASGQEVVRLYRALEGAAEAAAAPHLAALQAATLDAPRPTGPAPPRRQKSPKDRRSR